MLAHMVKATCPQGYRIVPFDLPEFDIINRQQVDFVLGELKPDIILNCAAMTNVDGCESQQELAFKVNGDGPGHLAAAAKAIGAVLLQISTDFVFAGDKQQPYQEADETGPLSNYGASKLQGEKLIESSGLKEYIIIRTSWLYGPGGNNFVETILRLASEREQLKVVADQVGTPTYTGDLAAAIWTLIETQSYGIYHFSNLGQCSWYEFAKEIIDRAREKGLPLKLRQLEPIPTDGYPLPATRPAYSVMSKEKLRSATGLTIPQWQESVQTYFQQRS